MNLTKQQQYENAIQWARVRQKARIDLFYLANEILAPPDSRILVPRAHGCIVDHCQKFAGRHEKVSGSNFRKNGAPVLYASVPFKAMHELEGPRDGLLLVSRGHLKTTVHTVAHSIQWILNYPDIRILICTATDEKARMMLKEIKEAFQFNPRLRFFFPEFCPDTKVSDFGSQTEFTTPARTRRFKEPTVMTAAVGKALASTHHDVIKCSDVVTENNVGTPGQIADVKQFFGYLEPLRERFPSKDGHPNPGWLDVEGTIYNNSDYYQDILDKKPKGMKITKQSCWVDKEKRVSLWPETFPPEELDRIFEKIGPVLFASQYELDPVTAEDGLCQESQIRWFPAHIVNELMPRYRVHTTVDLAGMDPQTEGDSTVFDTCGFDRDGRCDVLSIIKGRFTLDHVMDLFFAIQKVYPANVDFKVQKDHFARVIEPMLRREMAKRNQWLNVVLIPISNRISKQQRIRGLQSWFLQGLIRFADNISCRNELILEILRFPKYAHDDILDTLADQMQNRDGRAHVDLLPDAPKFAMPDPTFNPFMGFDPITMEERWFRDTVDNASKYVDTMTGI